MKTWVFGQELVKKIAYFANNQHPRIPIFVDPKRDKSKYEGIEFTAIMPNLEEWCHLVDQPSEVGEWRKRIENPEQLEKMAEISFSKLGNFKYHIITTATFQF